MSSEKKLEFADNPEFNRWLEDNYSVEIEKYEYPSSSVLYQVGYDDYEAALERYKTDPQIALHRITESFPSPIAYYYDQAQTNYQNEHHRLDLLKSCWESVIFVLFGLVVSEARHRGFPLKSLGIKYEKYWSDRLFDKLNIVENILDHVSKNAIQFHCANIVPIEVLGQIQKLNKERNGFEHVAAQTSAQRIALFNDLCPQLETVLRRLINLENVVLFRYHSAEMPLYPRCEIFNGASLDGKKDIIPLTKENYVAILDHFNANSIFAQIESEAFCLSPFIHFSQEVHETNALICFYKKDRAGKYQYEVVSKSQEKAFEKSCFIPMEDSLRKLIV